MKVPVGRDAEEMKVTVQAVMLLKILHI